MPRAGLTVQRLAHAGAEIADADGLDAVTVSAVARRFDVKPASLYSHVRSTADLVEQVTRLALDELADAVADALAGRSGKDALVAFADAYRDYARTHPGRYAAAHAPVSPAATATIDAGRRHSELSRAVLRGYDLDGLEQTHAVRLLGSTVHGFVALEAGGGFAHSDPDAQASWERCLDVLDVALRSWPA